MFLCLPDLHISLSRGSPYQIFVRELVAMDGRDASEILLIDSVGEYKSLKNEAD